MGRIYLWNFYGKLKSMTFKANIFYVSNWKIKVCPKMSDLNYLTEINKTMENTILIRYNSCSWALRTL